MNFNLFQQQNQIHNQYHLVYPTVAQVQFYHIDLSCQICYSPQPANQQFQNFWDWYSTVYPAVIYNSNTQNSINNLVNIQNPQQGQQLLTDLIFSIRYYNNPGPIQQIIQEVANAIVQTQYFINDPFEALYNISEYTGSTTSTISTGDLITTDTQSNTTESTTSESDNSMAQNQNQNQNRNLNRPNARDFQDVADELFRLTQALPALRQVLTQNTNAVNNPPRRESKVADIPIFYGGNQDPYEWYQDFDRSCNANGITDARKLEVVPAYLKGAASTWWSQNQRLANGNPNKIIAWTGPNNNTAFDIQFLAVFRTQTLVEIWTTELDRRRQQPGESVDTYAAALQELYDRVEGDGNFQYPENLKARKFVNGLKPELYVNVKPHNDVTWNAAVNRAKQYELTYQDTQAVSAYINKYAPVQTAPQMDTLNAAILNLTKQIEQMNTGRRNYNRQNNQTGGQQPNSNFNRNNLVCFNCGQPGHIKRNCPTLLNNATAQNPVNTTAVNNNIPNTTQPVQNDTTNQLIQMLAQLLPQNSAQSLN